MTLMLNDPGEPVVARERDTDSPHDSSLRSSLRQVAVILCAGAYLLGMVLLYIRLPLLLFAVLATAAGVVVAGALARARKPDPPED